MILLVKISFLFLTSILFFTEATAQSFEAKIERRINEMRILGVDTIISYSTDCEGCVLLQPRIQGDTSCHVYQSTQLFWVNKGLTYRQRITNCGADSIVHIKNSPFVDQVLTNLESIRTSELLPVEFYSNKFSLWKKERMTLSQVHDWYTSFAFYVGKTQFKKKLYHHKIETKMVNDHTKNLNYETNQKSVLKLLKDLVEAELD